MNATASPVRLVSRAHRAGLAAVLLATALASGPVAAELSTLGNQRIPTSADAPDGDGYGMGLAAGDFDGDGKPDLAIGEPYYDDGSGARGQIELFHGGGPLLAYETSFVGNAGSWMGRALAAGDFDGDGRDELAVGMPGDNGGYGRVRVYHRDGNANTPAWSLVKSFVYGDLAPNFPYGSGLPFAASALAVGDFDGDGRDDLAIGVTGARPSDLTGAGAVAVVYGSASGLDLDSVQWWHQDKPGVPGSAETDDRFGDELAAGDFDCDGRDDLAVGTPLEDVGALADAGYVVVLYGSAAGLTATGAIGISEGSGGMPGTAKADEHFGDSLAVGDFDRTNLFAAICRDLAIGVPQESGGGAVAVLYGSASGLGAAGRELLTTTDLFGDAFTGYGFGVSLAAAQFNGDLPGDLAIGMRHLGDEWPSQAGGVAVLHGGADGITTGARHLFSEAGLLVAPSRSHEEFGHTLVAANFDGTYKADLAIGIPSEVDNGTGGDKGAVVVLHSLAPLPPTPLLVDGFESGSVGAWSQKKP